MKTIVHADHFCQEKIFLLIDAKNKLQGIGTLPVIHVISFTKLNVSILMPAIPVFRLSLQSILIHYPNIPVSFASIIDILDKTKTVVSYA